MCVCVCLCVCVCVRVCVCVCVCVPPKCPPTPISPPPDEDNREVSSSVLTVRCTSRCSDSTLYIY